MKPSILTFFTIVILLISCGPENRSVPIVAASIASPEKVKVERSSLDKDYWYSGKAELTTYDLKQNRYNDIHDGKVISIFVTEDFLTDKQVKNDHYTNANSAPILKLNQIRRFTTGLYDYSIMTSVFTNSDGSGTEKITMSSQDWCGQSFVQLNKKGRKYNIQMRSYFESEGDQNVTISADLLEDELMNLIRIDPTTIPTGEVSVLPSLMSLRMKHKSHKSQKSFVTIDDYKKDLFTGKQLKVLTLDYKNIQRKLEIVFEASAPHEIIGWKESTPSVFDNKNRSTIASRLTTVQEPYWKMNQKKDEKRRESIGL